jgi:ribose transport system substrate-binding protein
VLNLRPSSPPRAGRAVALLVLVALAAAACVPSGAQQASPTPTLAPTASPSPNPYTGVTGGQGAGVKLGYVSYGELVPFVFEVSEGIRAQAALAGVKLVECDTKQDPTRVSGCMKQLSEAGVKGIIQFQGTLADPKAVCDETPAGMPVVAVEFAQEPCAKVLVAADDLRAGQIAGTAVGQWVKKTWSCTYDAYVSFESAVAAERSQRRMEGYRQGFTAACPITNEQIGRAIDTQATARQAMGTLLAALPGKSKIVVANVNDDAALGALDGATTAGRTADVWVSGQGAEARVRDLIRSNQQYLGDSAYFPERYGATIVPALLDLIAGKTVQPLLLVEPQWLDSTDINGVYPQ